MAIRVSNNRLILAPENLILPSQFEIVYNHSPTIYFSLICRKDLSNLKSNKFSLEKERKLFESVQSRC